MKTVKQLVSAVMLSILVSTAVAQTETTGNLVYTTINPAPTGAMPHSWTGFSVVNSTGGNTTSDNGAVTGYNPNTGTFMFGYNQGTIAYNYAINQALANSGSGIVVQGYDYSWQINNLNYDNRQGSTDTLTARIITFGPSGVVRRTDSWTYNTRFDWTTFSGTVNYVNPGAPSEFGNMRIEFTGRDTGFWAGYYGPMVRDIDVRLRYSVNPCVTNPQSSPSCPGYRTYYQMWDDGHARVDLPFAFPFYGQVFTTSYMYTNGVVGFLNNNWGFCCDGTNLHNQVANTNSPWNYAIYALNTDLIPGPTSEFYTQVTDNGTGLKYSWVNVPEIGTNLNNTFHVQIKDSGYIGITHDQVNLNSFRNPLIGIAGDISKGEYLQTYFGPASALPNLAGNTVTFTGTETTDICSINPLYNTSCAGYAQAFFDQQCSINALYNTACPGYAPAYFVQQCSINTLYDPACPGYATAYYNYQCSMDPLYHTGCPGYSQAYFNQQCSLDPLYNNQCPGYAAAYFDQQCTADPLYNTACPGHDDAYYVQQCTLDPLYDSGCTGYDAAFLAQQCGLNTLYDSACPGYAQAYFDLQCSINALYDQACPGYATAYFDQQCSLNTLYNNQCPGYAQAFYNLQCSISALYDSGCPGYATAYFDQQCGLDPLYNNQCPGYAQAYALKFVIAAPSVSSTPVVEETAAVAAAAADESAVATVTEAAPPAATASPAEPAAPVQLIAEPAPAATQAAAAAPAPAKTESTASAPRTTRQALAEQRLAAAREQAAKSAQENPGAVAAEMDSAASLEQQAAIQNVVLGAIGFVPGFDAYGRVTLPDGVGYRPFEIYPGQHNIDTPAARGLIGRSDRTHEEMVNEQYR
jgi:hypothetical protein